MPVASPLSQSPSYPPAGLAVPPVLTKTPGIKDGDTVLLRLTVCLYSRATAIERVQKLIARRLPPEVGLIDELSAERRHEAQRDGAS